MSDSKKELFNAARDGSQDQISSILAQSPDLVNEDLDGTGRTAIHIAARWGRVGTINALVDFGAHVDVADVWGATPLIVAAEYGKVDAVTALLRAGASLSLKDKRGKSAREWAAKEGYVDLATMLEDRADALELAKDQATVSATAAIFR
eukprot:c53650_g1_i1.p1 GENE.c53650_g1_i1~~c53650_g1_i1.p1  ORF type:complete len:175 (-),score=40.53 c53650_g1_i1:24-470(-)